MHGFDGGHMLWGGWWMLLLWFGAAVLFVWGLRLFFDDNSPHSTHPQTSQSLSALEIAKQRYARGEISRDDYLALIDDLNQGAMPSKTKRSE